MDKLLKYNGVQEALKFLREDDESFFQAEDGIRDTEL